MNGSDGAAVRLCSSKKEQEVLDNYAGALTAGVEPLPALRHSSQAQGARMQTCLPSSRPQRSSSVRTCATR